jgi:hypothetical protein
MCEAGDRRTSEHRRVLGKVLLVTLVPVVGKPYLGIASGFPVTHQLDVTAASHTQPWPPLGGEYPCQRLSRASGNPDTRIWLWQCRLDNWVKT